MTDNVVKAPNSFGKEKVSVLAIWFAGLIGVRLLLASLLALEGTLVSTVGSIGVIFVVFYAALKYTPLSRYSGTVNSVLFSWFSKKYFVGGVVSSMIVLSLLIFLVEYGYLYHSDNLVVYEQFRGINSDDENVIDAIQRILSLSPENISTASQDRQYRIIDTMSIVVASVDKSLGGYYVKAVSFILAENVEVLIFVILVRRFGEKGLFRSNSVRTIENSRLNK